MVNISTEIPEIYENLRATFGVDWEKDKLIIAYDNTIHCAYPIKPSQVIHEKTHLDRQKVIGVNNWWDEYINNKEFRLNEEILAYKAEYDFIKKHIKDREALFRYLHSMARALASHIYGSMIEYNQAIKLIKQ